MLVDVSFITNSKKPNATRLGSYIFLDSHQTWKIKYYQIIIGDLFVTLFDILVEKLLIDLIFYLQIK